MTSGGSSRPYFKRRLSGILLIVITLLLNACASLYFQALPQPRESLQIRTIEKLPYRELWHGFVFNGEKVGFMHFKMEPIPGGGQYRVSSEAYLSIRFLGMNKQISMKGEDIVRPDLTLLSFRHEQKMDEKTLILEGAVQDQKLRFLQESGNDRKHAEMALSAPLYPASVINLYPVIQGLEVGSRYRFAVFDPQTQSVVEVSQRVIGFEESKKLALEPSFKIETQMHGHSVFSWINPQGETVFELGMGGVLITYKEDEMRARQYLTEASLSKKDLIIDFSLVKTDKAIACPRQADYLEVILEGPAGVLDPIVGPQQASEKEAAREQDKIRYRIHRTPLLPLAAGLPLSVQDRALCLAADHHIESAHPEIRKAAADAASGAGTPVEQIRRLVKWVSAEVKDEAVDSFSALEVLHLRKGECQAHTMLYVAMARALEIPTRLVGGLVYMEGLGFLYHSWAESYADGWMAVDPTFDQVGVDATHIKLVEGPFWTSLLPLGKVIGRIKANVVTYSCNP